MERADVLVIGGGLIGCATAWHLARAGAAVVLAEAADLNAGASGQNAGSLHFQIERRFLENGEALADQAACIVRLNRLAIEDWRGLEAALGADLHVSMRGGLVVAETSAQIRLLEAKAEREAREGLATRLVDGEEARSIAPYLAPHIRAASYSTDEGHADPRTVVPAFAAAARAAGAVLHARTPVRAIARRPEGGFDVAVDAAGQRRIIRAGRLLVAAGAWTPGIAALANLHIPLYPVALLMNATARTAPIMPHLIQHVGHRLSMKQTHAGNILIGGGWPSRLALGPKGGFDLEAKSAMIDESLKGNLRVAVGTVPMVARLDLIRSWTGVTAISADQLPIVGEVPRVPGIYVAGGGSAFTLGPTFARLLSRSMAGENVEELEIVSPARFEHLNSFMG